MIDVSPEQKALAEAARCLFPQQRPEDREWPSRKREAAMDVSEIERMSKDGVSYSRIGVLNGVTRNTIAGLLYKARHPEAAKEYAKIVTERRAADSRQRRAGRAVDRQAYVEKMRPICARDHAIIKGLLDGKTIRQIGAKYGVTHQAISQRIKAMGGKGPIPKGVKS